MTDLERVLQGLDCVSGFGHCLKSEAFAGGICAYCMKEIAKKAKELLKEQEAVTIKKTKEHGFGVYGGICPKCRNWIQSSHSFCGFCGQAVKWE